MAEDIALKSKGKQICLCLYLHKSETTSKRWSLKPHHGVTFYLHHHTILSKINHEKKVVKKCQNDLWNFGNQRTPYHHPSYHPYHHPSLTPYHSPTLTPTITPTVTHTIPPTVTPTIPTIAHTLPTL